MKTKLIILFFIFFSLIFFEKIRAQEPVNVLCNFAKWVKNILLTMGVLGIIFGGYRILTSQGEPSKLEESKKFIIAVLVGMALIAAATTFITNMGLIANCQL